MTLCPVSLPNNTVKLLCLAYESLDCVCMIRPEFDSWSRGKADGAALCPRLPRRCPNHRQPMRCALCPCCLSCSLRADRPFTRSTLPRRHGRDLQRRRGQEALLHDGRAASQRVGAGRRVDHRQRTCEIERSQRHRRLSISRARFAPCARPGIDGKPVRFRVTVDETAPGNDHGVDITAAGEGVIVEQRLYQLVRQQGAVAERTFKIRFLDPGVEVFAFTFG